MAPLDHSHAHDPHTQDPDDPPRFHCRISLEAASSEVRRSLAVVLALTLGATSARAQTVHDNTWMPNGTVSAIAVSGNTAYFGGDFSRVQPPTGSFVSLDPTTGQPNAPYPLVNGQVTSVVGDGSGGWYIGGTFTAVAGQPRNNLAHIDASGAVTPWNPNADLPVFAVTRDFSSGLVYVGGQFSHVGGAARAGLVAIDGTTGAPTAWNPNASNSSGIPLVRTIILNGSMLYVGGSFTNIGGQPRNNAAQLDNSTGAATTWNPNCDSEVGAMGIRTLSTFPFTTTIYLGGNFQNVGLTARNRLASVDGVSAALTTWNPGADGYVTSMVLVGSPPTVYVGGDFTHLGGQPRNFAGAVNSSGTVTAWNPAPDQRVTAIGSGNGLIYMGGYFTAAGGQPRSGLAALDPTSGAATGWDPSPGGQVDAIVVSGSTVWIGGFFGAVGGVDRRNVAAIDVTSGQPTSWAPNADSTVLALLVNGGTVYAGGRFASIGGQARNRVAALDGTTGTATSWNPNANGEVKALAIRNVSPGLNLIYMGGSFTTVAGFGRSRLAAVSDAIVPQLDPWNPSVDKDVLTLFVSGSVIYAGGSFTGSLEAINLDGTVHAQFRPNAFQPCIVEAIVANGNRVFVGGFFNQSIGGRPREYFAVLDTFGVANTWDPYADESVECFAMSGTTLYVGGSFSQLAGASHDGLGEFDLTSGQFIPSFAPETGVDVRSLVVSNGVLYVGGVLSYTGTVSEHGFFAAFTVGSGGLAFANPGGPSAGQLRLSSNPFRQSLRLDFGLPQPENADVMVYDVAGRLVRRLPQGMLTAGEHEVTWDGRDDRGASTPSGMYFVRVETGAARLTAKALRLE
jgi:hypothetical protein